MTIKLFHQILWRRGGYTPRLCKEMRPDSRDEAERILQRMNPAFLKRTALRLQFSLTLPKWGEGGLVFSWYAHTFSKCFDRRRAASGTPHFPDRR